MMTLDHALVLSLSALVAKGQHLDYNGGSPGAVPGSRSSGFPAIPRFISSPSLAFWVSSPTIAVHARKNIFGYRMMVWAIVVIGGLSFVVWAHHMYVSGMNPYSDSSSPPPR